MNFEMNNILALLVFILSILIPIIYDSCILKKFRYSSILLFILFYLILLSYYFDNIIKEPIGGLIYGLPTVLILYIYSFVLFLKIIYFFIKKVLKNKKSGSN